MKILEKSIKNILQKSEGKDQEMRKICISETEPAYSVGMVGMGIYSSRYENDAYWPPHPEPVPTSPNTPQSSNSAHHKPRSQPQRP